MWRCRGCGAVFEEPDREEVCYERECGVRSLFSDRHYRTDSVCPVCGDYDIREIDEDELEDEEEEDG